MPGFASPEDIWENRQENIVRQTVLHQTIFVNQSAPVNSHYVMWDGKSPYAAPRTPRESACCPLLILLAGFGCPAVWLLGCCYLSARTARVRLLGRLSVCAFLLLAASSLVVTLHVNARTGRWPWDRCFWGGQNC